jgi:galactokinase
MTGGGFGGCTVTLLKKEAVEKAIQHIQVRGSVETLFASGL